MKLKADWPKGWSRLGSALQGLQRWDDAIDAYRKGALHTSWHMQWFEGPLLHVVPEMSTGAWQASAAQTQQP